MEETLCPTCGRDNSHLKQLALCGIAEESFHEYGICFACKKPTKRSELTCLNCGELGPLNIKCECGFTVRLDLDECRSCRRYGYYFEQLARCGIEPKEFSEFVFCGNCRQPFRKSSRICPNCHVENPNDNPSDKGTEIFNSFIPAAEGFIYILINTCMPNMVKIGKTTRTPEERANELSNTTGVPAKFIVAYEIEVSDCDAAESDTHYRLADFRVSEDREFFNLPLKTAIQIVEEMTQPYQL